MLSLGEAGITDDRLAALRAAAESARSTNYAPYSSYIVLAAVHTDIGVFGGSNVEIANYTLTKHAEETSVLAAIAAGAGPSGPWLNTLYVTAAPCGSCRQFIYEFSSQKTIVLVEQISQERLRTISLRDLAGRDPEVCRLADLLPAAFGPHDLLE